MVTPCPLCLSLDAWQSKLEAQTGERFRCRSSPLSSSASRPGSRIGAEVQAPRCPGRAGHGEAAGAVETASDDLASRRGRRSRRGRARVGALRGAVGGASGARRARPWASARLDGLRILHLSDFHLGTVSRSTAGPAEGDRLGAERDLDLVAVTGDLVSRRRGLLRELARLGPACGRTVLGNHDVASTRDPFSRPADLSGVAAAAAARSRVRGT